MQVTPIPYGNNAKKHSVKQVYKLALSIKEFGWKQPIVLGKDNVIVAGHGRWMAYLKYGGELGMDEPWVVDQEGNNISGEPSKKVMNEEQEKAYRLFDNLGSSSDYDMDLVLQESSQLGLGFQDMLKFEAVDSTEKPDEEEEKKITDEAMLAYLNRSVRQIVLHYEQVKYVPLYKKIEALNNILQCETTSDLFEKLVSEKHEQIVQ